MGKKKIIGIALCLLAMNSFAQKEQYIRPGLISASLGISPSWMLNRNEVNYNLTGFLEGFVSEKISFRGESHYMVGGNNTPQYFNFNCRTLFGAQYHLSKGNFDAHVGVLPGLSFMKMNHNVERDPLHVVPTLGVKVGMSYFVWKFFHFFADFTYTKSTAIRTNNINGQSDELYISAGLGLNINTIKSKK